MNKKYKILLTNDDGFDSPLLLAFIEALSGASFCSELRIVVPTEEQSWKSQACTRFELLSANEHLFGPVKGFVVNGTPADCVGLGLYNLFEEPADFVLSGINLGSNTSFPFYLNSATVGAVRHAFTFGVKGIALSVKVEEQVQKWWNKGGRIGENMLLPQWRELASLSVELVEELILERYWQGVDLYTINFPWSASAKTEKVITEPEKMTYLSPLYEKVESGYRHVFKGFKRGDYESNLGKDTTTLENAKISICPISHDLNLKNKDTLKFLQETFFNK